MDRETPTADISILNPPARKSTLEPIGKYARVRIENLITSSEDTNGRRTIDDGFRRIGEIYKHA
jgi:hypothetical protein